MYYVYVVRSLRDHQFYTGCTQDLRKRLMQHEAGEVVSTRLRIPLKLVYYEAYLNADDAYRRERYLKSGLGKRDLRKRLYNTLNHLAGTRVRV